MSQRPFVILWICLLIAGPACQEPRASEGAGGGDGRGASAGLIDPPLVLEDSAYATAATITLETRKPEEPAGLHNVYRLSDRIISGGEPEGEEALAAIAGMGVRTILSVDGKPPEAEAAQRHGLRYVHVPIQYSGISEDEVLKIVKTFRELDGPFYVHCFHGKHRGPAAAAIGRVVLDGAPRTQALAEMRQWCGTSSAYEGLYRTIAEQEMPPAATTAGYAFDFASFDEPKGLRPAMVRIARSHDMLKKLIDNGFAPDPSHPDIDGVNEAAKLTAVLRQVAEMPAFASKPEDFKAWMASSTADAGRLHGLLIEHRNGRTEAGAEAAAALRSLNGACAACHQAYRDH